MRGFEQKAPASPSQTIDGQFAQDKKSEVSIYTLVVICILCSFLISHANIYTRGMYRQFSLQCDTRPPTSRCLITMSWFIFRWQPSAFTLFSLLHGYLPHTVSKLLYMNTYKATILLQVPRYSTNKYF